jgi:hypothetical protein
MFRIKVVTETINLKQISYRSVRLVKRDMLEGMGPVKPLLAVWRQAMSHLHYVLSGNT